MKDGLAELYLMNSRNLKFYKHNKKAHQTHYKETITKLTNHAYIKYSNKEIIKLAEPQESLFVENNFSKVILARSSVRNYSNKPITFEQLSTLLFYSAGVKYLKPVRKRTVPSGGNLNSVDIYFFSLNVSGLNNGFYFYDFMEHSVVLIEKGDFKKKIEDDILYQPEFSEAGLLIIFVSRYERVRSKYGVRSLRITHIDCGALSENVHLVSEALDLGSCAIGGLIEVDIEKMLDIDGVNNFVVLAQTVGNKNV